MKFFLEIIIWVLASVFMSVFLIGMYKNMFAGFDSIVKDEKLPKKKKKGVKVTSKINERKVRTRSLRTTSVVKYESQSYRKNTRSYNEYKRRKRARAR